MTNLNVRDWLAEKIDYGEVEPLLKRLALHIGSSSSNRSSHNNYYLEKSSSISSNNNININTTNNNSSIYGSFNHTTAYYPNDSGKTPNASNSGNTFGTPTYKGDMHSNGKINRRAEEMRVHSRKGNRNAASISSSSNTSSNYSSNAPSATATNSSGNNNNVIPVRHTSGRVFKVLLNVIQPE